MKMPRIRLGGKEVPPEMSPEDAPELSPEQLEARTYSVELREELLKYQDEWSKKIIEAHLPTSNKNVLPFAQARSVAMNLAEQYGNATNKTERDQIMSLLESKVRELKGPLTENLEKAIGEADAYRGQRSETPVAETKGKLVSLLAETKILGMNGSALEEKAPKSPEELEAQKAERAEQREAVAENFAAKYGISEQRQAMLDAEKAYAEAIRAKNAKILRNPINKFEVPEEIQREYDAARLAWLKALDIAVPKSETLTAEEKEDLSPGGRALRQDRIQASMIAKRDAILRQGTVRTEALKAGLDERGQKAIAKVMSWAERKTAESFKDDFAALGGLARGYSKVSEWVGTGGGLLAGAAIAKGYEMFGKEVSEERRAAITARAKRIIGSAAIWSLLVPGGLAVAGVGAVAAGGVGVATLSSMGLGALIRITRGTVGIVAGGAAGSLAGKAFDKGFGFWPTSAEINAESKADLLSIYKDTDFTSKVLSPGELERLKNIHEDGNTEARAARERRDEKSRAFFEMTIAAMIGGASALEAGQVINEDLFGAHSAVEQAQNALKAVSHNPDPGQHTTLPNQSSGSEPITYNQASGNVDKAPGSIKVPVVNEPLNTEHSAVTPQNYVVGATIHEPGEGTGKLFEELKANIRENGLLKGDHPSAALKHFLETNPNELSREMGAVFGERGMTMHAGDSFFVDENQNVWFESAGKAPQLFIENNHAAPHGFTVHHDIKGEPLPAEKQPLPEPKHQEVKVPVAEEKPAVEATHVQAKPEPQPEPPHTTSNPEPAPIERPAPNSLSAPDVTPEVVSSVPSAEHAPTPVTQAPEPLPASSTPEPEVKAPVVSAETVTPENHATETSNPMAQTQTMSPNLDAATNGPLHTEPFINHLNFKIDPTVPKAYPYTDETGQRYVQIYGGKDMVGLSAVQQAAIQLGDQYKDAIFQFEVWDTNSLGVITHEYGAGAFDENGVFLPLSKPDMPDIDPERFDRTLSFNYENPK